MASRSPPHAYVNLPFLGDGDTGWMSATYTDGAVGYINAGQAGPISNAFISAGPLALPFADAFVDPFTGEFKTNKAYGVAGGINHDWTPGDPDERLRLLDALRCSRDRAVRRAGDCCDDRRRHGRYGHGPG